jgi:hypothetical protein
MSYKWLNDNGLTTIAQGQGIRKVGFGVNNSEDFPSVLIPGGADASGIDGISQTAANGRQKNGGDTFLRRERNFG